MIFGVATGALVGGIFWSWRTSVSYIRSDIKNSGRSGGAPAGSRVAAAIHISSSERENDLYNFIIPRVWCGCNNCKID